MDAIKQQIDPLISPDILEMCKVSAGKHGVVSNIHTNDFIFHFLITNPCFYFIKDAVEYYFNDGAKSAKKLANILYSDLKFQKGKPFKLLEFASGYGCVTRHLSQELPNVTIISCDIHKEAVNFINKQFSTEAILSESVPERLRLERNMM